MGRAEVEALERRVRHDLATVEVPARAWLTPRRTPAGPIADVVVVGAGLSGLTIAFGLKRKGVDNIRVVDAAPAGEEGPWITTARMETLRSPKTLSGLDYGIPALTYRAWHEATHGTAHFDRLDKVDRGDWMAYLAWFREVLGIPVENRTTLTAIGVDDGHLALGLARAGSEETALCRKLVLATGIAGAGGPAVPETIRRGVDASLWTHSHDLLDPARLCGGDVLVLGAAASAFDWAVAALTAGASRVQLLARSPALPVTEVLDWSNFPGFLEHFAELGDDWRFRFTERMRAFRTPPTQAMFDRATADPRFTMLSGALVAGAATQAGRVALTLTDGRTLHGDHLLLGTGYAVDLGRRPELAGVAGSIALWRDRYSAPEEHSDSSILDHPYLGAAFQCMEKHPGEGSHVRHIHVFNNGALPSLGPVCNGVTGLKYGAPRLVAGITRALFMEDIETHYDALDAFDKAHFTPAMGAQT